MKCISNACYMTHFADELVDVCGSVDSWVSLYIIDAINIDVCGSVDSWVSLYIINAINIDVRSSVDSWVSLYIIDAINIDVWQCGQLGVTVHHRCYKY